jgi:acyl-CoA thioester hydrolase
MLREAQKRHGMPPPTENEETMAKIKLKPRGSYQYQYNTTINVRDVNYGGHLGNDAVVALLQEARLRLLRDLGCSELDLGDGETGIIMNELAVNYQSEGYLFDEISVLSEITDVKAASFRIQHRVIRGDTTLALAEVGIVAFNYTSRSISEIPKTFINKLEN